MSTTKATASDVEQLVKALFTVNASLDRARRRSKGAGALALLQALEGHDGVRPSAIAAAVQVHPSFATRQVQELEESGYVLVTADDGDRRSCLVALTEQGHAELERLRRIGL